jgi:hypothetical protein
MTITSFLPNSHPCSVEKPPCFANLCATDPAESDASAVANNRYSYQLATVLPETKIVVCKPQDAPLLGIGIAQQHNPDGSPAAAHPAFKPHPMQ